MTLWRLAVLTLLMGFVACSPGPTDVFSDPQSAQLADAVAAGDLTRLDRTATSQELLNATGRNGRTLLDVAVTTGRIESFQRLLELGADPNIQNPESGSTIVHRVGVNTDPRWLVLALRFGGDPNISDAAGNTPLFTAISARSPRHLDLLLAAGADPDHQNAMGETVSMYTAGLMAYPLVLHLLEAGASTQPRNKWGQDLAAIVDERVPADSEVEASRSAVIDAIGARNAGHR